MLLARALSLVFSSLFAQLSVAACEKEDIETCVSVFYTGNFQQPF